MKLIKSDILLRLMQRKGEMLVFRLVASIV